jgi:lipopolysaccharide biosynthesis glycosyltransferase
MKQMSAISIVLACDNHYFIMLGGLLKSIEINHKSGELLDIYIVDDNTSYDNKIKLKTSLDQDMFQIHWIDKKDAIPDGFVLPVINNTYPLNTYYRILIPFFLPEGIQKVLYMDVDMIVEEEISKLWNIDISDFIIGAVPDSNTRFIGNTERGAEGIVNYRELGLNPNTKYFNAGLLLINVAKWIEYNVTERVFSIIKQNSRYAGMGDQYGLNVVLSDRFLEIDSLWNCLANSSEPSPRIIHFIHRKPFYKSYSYNKAYQNIFYKYISKTKWNNSPPVGETTRYLKKIDNVLKKIIYANIMAT